MLWARQHSGLIHAPFTSGDPHASLRGVTTAEHGLGEGKGRHQMSFPDCGDSCPYSKTTLSIGFCSEEMREKTNDCYLTMAIWPTYMSRGDR